MSIANGFSGAARAAAALFIVAASVGVPRADTRRSPVLVELFTAEGCSSCPPADAVLARLVQEQPVAGAEIIALGFHVDYWDELGWRDRFASPLYTARQNRYASVWQQARIYTPQMVVDGGVELIGSDWNGAGRAIGTAAAAPKLGVTLATDASASARDGRVALRIDVQPSVAVSGKADVFLALTEDGLVSDVLRGENEAKRLSHVAVVRSLDRVGAANPGQAFATTRTVSIGRGWSRERVKAVVFVQDTKSRRVLGAAVLQL
jgi:hypothetical protein